MTLAATILGAGALGDAFGRRRMFMMGLAGSAASALFTGKARQTLADAYVSRLLTKLGAPDRPHLVVLAYQTGLIVPGA